MHTSIRMGHALNAATHSYCAGLHCEGGVWSMLFGLLMWDCLFADVPDTLRSQFQLAPLDLSTPHFYEVTCAHILLPCWPLLMMLWACAPPLSPLWLCMVEACCCAIVSLLFSCNALASCLALRRARCKRKTDSPGSHACCNGLIIRLSWECFPDAQLKRVLHLVLQARRESIEEQLQQIRAGDTAQLVRQAWEGHHGVMCAGVYWDRYSERLS